MYNRCVKNWFKILKHLWKNVRKLQDAGGGIFLLTLYSVPGWVVFKLVVMMFGCVHGQAPQSTPVSPSTVCQCLTSLHDSICDLPVVNFSSYRCIYRLRSVSLTGLHCGWPIGLVCVTSQFARSWHWLTQLQRHQFTTYLSIYIMLLIYKSTFYLLTSLLIMYSSKTLYEYWDNIYVVFFGNFENFETVQMFHNLN